MSKHSIALAFRGLAYQNCAFCAPITKRIDLPSLTMVASRGDAIAGKITGKLCSFQLPALRLVLHLTENSHDLNRV